MNAANNYVYIRTLQVMYLHDYSKWARSCSGHFDPGRVYEISRGKLKGKGRGRRRSPQISRKTNGNHWPYILRKITNSKIIS